MRRMSINDQEDRTALSVDQALQEVDEHPRADTAAYHHEAHFTTRTDGRYHVEAEALSCDPHHRSLALRRPGRSTVKVRTHSRFIFEENLCLLALGSSADLRKLLLQPALDQGAILLVGTEQRALTGQPQLRQKSSDRHETQLDREPLRDQRPNLRSRPKREGKLELQRILCGHGVVEPADLL